MVSPIGQLFTYQPKPIEGVNFNPSQKSSGLGKPESNYENFFASGGIYNGGSPVADTTGGSSGYNGPELRGGLTNHRYWA